MSNKYLDQKTESELFESEHQTRIQRINVALEESGWNVNDRAVVVEEVDTKQSDFKVREYKTVDETLRNDQESKYADYLLLDKIAELTVSGDLAFDEIRNLYKSNERLRMPESWQP